MQPKQTKPILCDPDVKSYLEALRKRFSIVTTHKTANNFAFMYKKYYISKLLGEVHLSNLKFKTYLKPIEEIIQITRNYQYYRT